MPKSIEIVTHVWSGPQVPIFHKHLLLQVDTALSCAPPDLEVVVSIWRCSHDELSRIATHKLIQTFGWRKVRVYVQPLSLLFRRAVGRNYSALRSEADVVWFADVDHLFLDGCLEAAWRECLDSERNMVHPRVVNINKTHDLGDQMIDVIDVTKPFWYKEHFRPSDFYPREEKKAIGGIQIVKGDWCRQHGYLNETDWICEVDPTKGWDFKDDIAFRRAVGGSVAVDIPGLYRVRHGRSGRDHGKKDHGRKTRSPV